MRGLVPLAILAVVAVVAGAIAGVQARSTLVELRDRVTELEAEAAAGSAQLAGLERELEEMTAAATATGDRLASLEAALAAAVDPSEVTAAVLASVLTVETPLGAGSGFVLSSDGGTSLVVTNRHVVEATWATGRRDVTLRHRERVFPGTILRLGATADLALIEMRGSLEPLELSETEPAPGDPVMAVGSPLGLEGSVSSGVVSSLREEDGNRYLQFSAPVNPGNSGGPVVDADGAVVGITVAKVVGDGVEGVSFAVPVDDLCPQLAVGCA